MNRAAAGSGVGGTSKSSGGQIHSGILHRGARSSMMTKQVFRVAGLSCRDHVGKKDLSAEAKLLAAQNATDDRCHGCH
jgi:hypothetical protein